MELKITNFEENYLKDYLVIVSNIKEMPFVKIEQAFLKLKKLRSGPEKEEILRVIIESNLKFVVAAACRYRGAGLSFARLIKAGNRGLIRAVKNSTEPEVFFCYAAWSVEGAIIDEFLKERRALVQKKS